MHKILLVEDDNIIRQQVKQLLEQWGYGSGRSRGFYGCPWDLCRNRPPLDPYGYWPSTLQWVPLVPGDSQGFKGSDHVSFFTGSSHGYCHGHQYGETTLSPSLLTKMCSLPRFKDSCAVPTNFGTDQNLLEHRGAILNLKSTDLVYEGKSSS